jgi:myo-inositol-1(or 4)-monophosphatase
MQTPQTETVALYQRALEVAQRAARRAAELITAAAGNIHPADIREKGVNDIVTDVDERSQATIVETLLEAFPDHKMLAEEGLDMRSSDGRPAEFLWIIDPIDGTTNFTRGIPPYAVSIALAHEGRLVVGAVYDVPHDEMHTAYVGGGLRVNGKPARVRPTENLADAILTTGFPYRAFGHIDLYLKVLRDFMRDSKAVRRPGAASVDLAWVAGGRFDGFFETGLNPWDVAAGIVLVREGGGQITNYRGDPNPTFEHQIVASNGKIHDEMLALLEPMKGTYD